MWTKEYLTKNEFNKSKHFNNIFKELFIKVGSIVEKITEENRKLYKNREVQTAKQKIINIKNNKFYKLNEDELQELEDFLIFLKDYIEDLDHFVNDSIKDLEDR